MGQADVDAVARTMTPSAAIFRVCPLFSICLRQNWSGWGSSQERRWC
jgi:hypothetical protein